MALNIHGLVRATEDLDIFVRPDPDNVERLRLALKAVWADPEIDRIGGGQMGLMVPIRTAARTEGPITSVESQH